MKGTELVLNGDAWTVVDVAPAMPLAEMVAALLEEEGFVAVVRAAAGIPDALTHLGVSDAGVSIVLVPSADAARALELIAATVTDYTGDDLEAVLADLERDPSALGVSDVDDDDEDELRGGDALDDDDHAHADLDRLDRS